MNRVVIDTNVLISSILSSSGSPAKIMDLVSDKQVQVFYSLKIMDEYKRVLEYKKLGISSQIQEQIIEAIEELGTIVEPIVSSVSLIDEDDRIFYDSAKASEAILITGNIKHYPAEQAIMSPAEFLLHMGGQIKDESEN